MEPHQHSGWAAWVNHQIGHLHLRLHHVEINQAVQIASDRVTKQPAPPADRVSIWKELLQVVVALGSMLRWVFAILVVLGLLFRIISVSDLSLVKLLVGG